MLPAEAIGVQWAWVHEVGLAANRLISQLSRQPGPHADATCMAQAGRQAGDSEAAEQPGGLVEDWVGRLSNKPQCSWLAGWLPATCLATHLSCGPMDHVPPVRCQVYFLNLAGARPHSTAAHTSCRCSYICSTIAAAHPSPHVHAVAFLNPPLHLPVLAWSGLAVLQTGLELDLQYRLPKMRYKGGDSPLPQMIRVDPSLLSSGDGRAGSNEGGGASKPLIAEVPAQPPQAERGEEGTPAFALLAGKRQQRQQAAGAAAALQQKQRQVVSGAAGPAAAGAAAEASSPAPSGGQVAASPAASVEQQGQAQAQGQLPQLQPRIEYVGKPATAVSITIPLPPAAAAAAASDPHSLRTTVCAEAVQVQAPGCEVLEMRLPFAVSAGAGRAELAPAGDSPSSSPAPTPAGKSSTSVGMALRLHLPYRPFSSVLEELRQAQAAAAADGQRQGGSAEEVGGDESGLMELD